MYYTFYHFDIRIAFDCYLTKQLIINNKHVLMEYIAHKYKLLILGNGLASDEHDTAINEHYFAMNERTITYGINFHLLELSGKI